MIWKAILFGKKIPLQMQRSKWCMNKLRKYHIDSEKALEFIHWNLENLNELSEAVLYCTPFDKGTFYTFLQDGITKDQLYKFRSGCGSSACIQENAIEILSNELLLSSDMISIFDAFDHSYDESGDWQFFDRVGLHFKNEVYFLVQAKEMDKELLQHCFYNSDCIWHSLIVTSSHRFIKRKEQAITSKELETIAKNAKFVMLRAYDQEGYIIWEKNYS